MFVKKGGTAWFLFFFGMNFEENDDSHFFIYVYVLDKHDSAKKKIFGPSCDLLWIVKHNNKATGPTNK